MVYHVRMRIEVLCFAAARDATGAPRLELELHEGATVGDAEAALTERCPALRPLASGLRYAVNEEFAPRSSVLHDRDTLALVPPVSGG